MGGGLTSLRCAGSNQVSPGDGPVELSSDVATLQKQLLAKTKELEQARADLKLLKKGQAPSSPSAEALLTGLPVALLTDSYKAAHFAQYPDAKRMVAYGCFRKAFKKEGGAADKTDTRLIFYGMRYIVNSYFNRQWTMHDVSSAAQFYSTHNAGFTQFPFPRELFEKFVKENNGYLPVKLEALPEGTVVHAGCPVFQITAEAPYSHLCTFMETLLTHVWYPSTVATLSRRAKDVIEVAFEKSVDGGKGHPVLMSRLHDFGFRGCTCVEQSVIGGAAHLLNFEGSDTMSAAYYAQYTLNGGEPVGNSVPATEHSVMTSWTTEQAALEHMIDKFGSGVFACVMDSYDYAYALSEILPVVASKQVGKGGFMVLRPDSGDPVEAVLMGLKAADKVFGHDVNTKGFKVPRGCGVIQGDGIDLSTLQTILDAVHAEGYSAQSVGFGMGAGLLQKVNRDTMSFATKLCHIDYADGTPRDVMKAPKTDAGKYSLPGVLQVKRVGGVATAYSIPNNGTGTPLVAANENVLHVVYDKRPVAVKWENFSELRKRVATEWEVAPKTANNISPELVAAQAEVSASLHVAAGVA